MIFLKNFLNRPDKTFKNLKVALVADEITNVSLSLECRVSYITPLNYKILLKLWRPDLLLVESAWEGYQGAWKFKVASYPDYPARNNNSLKKLVQYARGLKIPTVFWNKEDCVHFERFIQSASLFDFIFTVDENSIPIYKKRLGEFTPVHTLMFAAQPCIHFPTSESYINKNACFVGSYSQHIHQKRRQRQDMLFSGAAPLGVKVFDRNSKRPSTNYRFPNLPHLEILPKVPYIKTANIYRSYIVSLNVNTIEDSPTMFSRRLIEIIASGGLAVTKPALSVERYFREYCYIVSSETQTKDLLSLLKEGWRPQEKERARAGADYILTKHTWSHRLETILQVIQ